MSTNRQLRIVIAVVFATLGLLLTACGSSSEPAVDGPAETAQTSAPPELAEPETATEAASPGDDGVGDDVDLDADPNPAAGDIRELIAAQASVFDWSPDQVECISNAVVATGEPSPGDVPNDEYAQIIAGCGALRGQLEFALGIMLDPEVASCLVDALSESEVNELGIVVLEDTFEAAEAATDEVLASYPECG